MSYIGDPFPLVGTFASTIQACICFPVNPLRFLVITAIEMPSSAGNETRNTHVPKSSFMVK